MCLDISLCMVSMRNKHPEGVARLDSYLVDHHIFGTGGTGGFQQKVLPEGIFLALVGTKRKSSIAVSRLYPASFIAFMS